ncbi:class I SAM-dependent methyltransferase [Phaeobacter sp. B1627]|uniref:class I SAM-dependent methyltransferase n=1 Tax=Phaeobacter sp. B1627 TaxID=2583809 RepID=UPI00111B7DBA|nr:SAM-dependent methyltransferase [Phaeobacter sp. B1627]TNJ48503.1 class I SAM-dependent methyltransferase [Phaeobacter sp. B1627]
MTLKASLKRRILLDGPISIADYMSDCLLHPEFGYYTTGTPIGTEGDFITAPEISQMFGELLGLALVQAWLDQGSPAPFTLAELGPGRGTLMSDLLRATASVPGFHTAMDLVLIEASPRLRARQAEALSAHAPRWLPSVEDLPQQPLYLVANEFFDALPIRQFQRAGEGWRERRVGWDDAGNTLMFGLGAEVQQPALAHRLQDTREGDLVETCEVACVVTEAIAQRIADHGGTALLVDYGDWRSLGDTLQALRAQAPADPLQDPGQADLTAHVDFEALALAARAAGCAHTRLSPQGVVLERLGITERARTLAAPLDGDPLAALIAAHRRLTHPEEMGNLFKVLGLYPAQSAPPAGLEP